MGKITKELNVKKKSLIHVVCSLFLVIISMPVTVQAAGTQAVTEIFRGGGSFSQLILTF